LTAGELRILSFDVFLASAGASCFFVSFLASGLPVANFSPAFAGVSSDTSIVYSVPSTGAKSPDSKHISERIPS